MMANSLKTHPAKEKRAYETAFETYVHSLWEFKDTPSDAARRRWQQSLLGLIEAYVLVLHYPVIFPKYRRRALSFPWEPLHDIQSALGDVLDGKDTDLFLVTPSDRYAWQMRYAIALAVRYVIDAVTNENKQSRKRYIMKEYGISRSTLNEWIRTKEPSPPIEPEFGYDGLSSLADHYRENKLTGRRRKP
jgi:hypothetical protein